MPVLLDIVTSVLCAVLLSAVDVIEFGVDVSLATVLLDEAERLEVSEWGVDLIELGVNVSLPVVSLVEAAILEVTE